MSVIILRKDTGQAVCEVSDDLAKMINHSLYYGMEPKEYLEKLNRELNGGLTYKDKIEQGLIK